MCCRWGLNVYVGVDWESGEQHANFSREREMDTIENEALICMMFLLQATIS